MDLEKMWLVVRSEGLSGYRGKYELYSLTPDWNGDNVLMMITKIPDKLERGTIGPWLRHTGVTGE